MNLIYVFVMLGFYCSESFHQFLRRFNKATVYVYVVYQLAIVVVWLLVGIKLHILVSSYARQANSMLVFRLNAVMFIVFITTVGRCVMLLYESETRHVPVGYLFYCIFTMFFPFFVGNLVLLRLMTWSNKNEASFRYGPVKSSGMESDPESWDSPVNSQLFINDNSNG